ncbi:MAG TPA: hypothetical protein VHB77_01600 [Planctomycetaceae bacterium]|nr:hypothetical protein [Planctomycetaceae bacterium]
MEKRRGWWALAGFAVATLLTLYVGAYYSLVTTMHHHRVGGWASPVYGPSSRHRMLEPLFRPLHYVDRQLRPESWKN